MSEELPGVEDYLTLLDKASQVPWKFEELFNEGTDQADTSEVLPPHEL
jgi:hypothetical protein